MATNTRQARRDAEHLRKQLYDVYYNEFASKFHNSVKIENLPADLPKRYLLRTLMTKGGIARDKQTGLYLPFVYGGIDVYGLPKYYNLIGYNGLTMMRDASEVDILRANDLCYPIENYLEVQIEKIIDFDMTIRQNLDAVKTMTIVEVQDRPTLLSLANKYEAKQIGATVVFENSSANVNGNTNVYSTGAQYLCTDLMQDRQKIINETLAHIGISSANTDKAERVQGIEVTASQGNALASIDVLIDTFNHDAEIAGLDIRLVGNTSLTEDRERQVTEQEQNEVAV